MGGGGGGGGLMSASVSTAQCSEIPGTLQDDFINPGLLIIQRSKMFCLWWVLFVLGSRHLHPG